MFIIRPVVLLVALFTAPLAIAAAATDADDTVALLSGTIQFAPEFRADVHDMLRRSPTFREQYRRIASAPSTIVGVHFDARLCATNFRARSTFRRYASGLIVVAVSIGPGPHRAEWIAHEFEHILEQLDGRDLPGLARADSGDVWYSGQNVIETGRAVRAGRAVLEEVLKPQPTQ